MPKTIKRYTFQGDSSQRPKTPHPQSPDLSEPYIADPPLIRAINLAIYLRRPLLLEGEAGCGKTSVAAAIAYELGLPLYRWDVRSTSKAQEGLYTYDALLRLHDVQAQKVDASLQRNPSKPKDYRKFGAIGNAFQLEDCPGVVLIDEIDKADLDFPNDLLTVLDDPWAFEIPETGETGEHKIKAHHQPIVIITSNKEKGNLPAPFLRRCVYYFVKFPDSAERLQEIVKRHYRAQEPGQVPAPALVETAANRFLESSSSRWVIQNSWNQ